MAKSKIPKKVAGVKVPKKVRKTGEGIADILRHPLVADLVAAGLLAAAAAIRDNPKVKDAGRKAKRKAGKAAKEVGSGAASLGTVIAAAARDGIERVSEAYQSLEHNGSGLGAGKSKTAIAKKKKVGGKKKAKA